MDSCSVIFWTISGTGRWSCLITLERGRLKREAGTSSSQTWSNSWPPMKSSKAQIYSDFEDASQGSDTRICPPSSLLPATAVGFYYWFTGVLHHRQRAADTRPRRMQFWFVEVSLKEVFEALNESRDPDRAPEDTHQILSQIQASGKGFWYVVVRMWIPHGGL